MTPLLHFRQFPREFMISVASFKSSPTQHDVYFVNYGHILEKNRRYSRVNFWVGLPCDRQVIFSESVNTTDTKLRSNHQMVIKYDLVTALPVSYLKCQHLKYENACGQAGQTRTN